MTKDEENRFYPEDNSLSATERSAVMYDWIFDKEGNMSCTIQECRDYITSQLIAYADEKRIEALCEEDPEIDKALNEREEKGYDRGLAEAAQILENRAQLGLDTDQWRFLSTLAGQIRALLTKATLPTNTEVPAPEEI